MQNKTIKVLGINPGARHIGYAFFQNSELQDWGVKVVKGKWSAEKSKKIGRILIGLLDQHQPDVLAIKKLHPARTSANLHGLVNSFKKHCQLRNIQVFEYPIKHLESVVLTEKMNKMKLVEALAGLYPALYHEAAKEQSKAEKKKSRKNSYFTRMFEAVALGHVCFNQLDNQ